ncbi:hypothetical protein Sta7437_2955 [Stanieria cyanosphaera PCC 7437]|uniref:Uncharacterized protein n=1 Tax=Stanieria cyanosphaera (strain ATCC 29371 / PCC 7437) TaxID=111780 RepID=K9XWM3_STAC7|nr:hypothetical protein [Stanieria cyanosphaera]AFZ36474.1 hypothetical protein Sta7437_2955 [Stanieria cyanosphaera PCC 7437]
MTNSAEHPDNYDRIITPAETAARVEREKENFKQLPEQEGDLDTTAGYTIDREGLANNYAIEPEMYVEEPGDLREKEEALKQERAEELEEINKPDNQQQEKGQGII